MIPGLGRAAGEGIAYTSVGAQSCPTLRDPMDCSMPDSSVHGIFQSRMRSGLPFPTPGDLLTQGSNLHFLQTCIGRWIRYHCATWEAYETQIGQQ